MLYSLNLTRSLNLEVHAEIFTGKGFTFSKTNQYPIVVDLFLPLIKILASRVKQGFAITCSCILLHLLIQIPSNSDLVVGCEDRV